MSLSRRTFPLLAALLTALLVIPAAANATPPTAPPHMEVVPGDPSSSTYFRFYTDISDDTAQCRVADDAGAEWTVCQDDSDNGRFEPQLADGQHTVEIREVNAAHEPSPVYSYTWTLDTVAPAPATITSAPDATTTNTTATFAFSSEPGAYFICDLDGNAGMQYSDDCDSPRTYTDLAVGTHTFKVWAIDAAGNGSPASEYSFTVTAPQPTTPPPTTTATTPTPAALSNGKLSSHTLTKKHPVKVSFTASKPSTVTLTLTQKVKGKTKTAAKVSFKVKAGKGSYTLSTKVAKRNLPKGTYTLSLQTTAGTQLSKSITQKLTVR